MIFTATNDMHEGMCHLYIPSLHKNVLLLINHLWIVISMAMGAIYKVLTSFTS